MTNLSSHITHYVIMKYAKIVIELYDSNPNIMDDIYGGYWPFITIYPGHVKKDIVDRLLFYICLIGGDIPDLILADERIQDVINIRIRDILKMLPKFIYPDGYLRISKTLTNLLKMYQGSRMILKFSGKPSEMSAECHHGILRKLWPEYTDHNEKIEIVNISNIWIATIRMVQDITPFCKGEYYVGNNYKFYHEDVKQGWIHPAIYLIGMFDENIDTKAFFSELING